MPERLFIFIQMEFPWALGPPDGRYLLRARLDGEAEHVVVLNTLGAGHAAAGRRPARAGRAPAPGGPGGVDLGTAALARARSASDAGAGPRPHDAGHGH